MAWQTETALDDDWIRIQAFLGSGGTFAYAGSAPDPMWSSIAAAAGEVR